jgi:glycosyltransferase involved in cell wall biosynthesis
MARGIPQQSLVELQKCRSGELLPPCPGSDRAVEARSVVLCVGQLVPRKEVNLMLDAAAYVQGEGMTFSFLIVGSGPEKPYLEERDGVGAALRPFPWPTTPRTHAWSIAVQTF